MLLSEWLTPPKGIDRTQDAQQAVDEACRHLALYQFKTCPFCIKVRRELRRLSLNLELRDAQKDTIHREELMQQGGQIKVPCLRIKQQDNQSQWLYESDDIIRYLNEQFG